MTNNSSSRDNLNNNADMFYSAAQNHHQSTSTSSNNLNLSNLNQFYYDANMNSTGQHNPSGQLHSQTPGQYIFQEPSFHFQKSKPKPYSMHEIKHSATPETNHSKFTRSYQPKNKNKTRQSKTPDNNNLKARLKMEDGASSSSSSNNTSCVSSSSSRTFGSDEFDNHNDFDSLATMQQLSTSMPVNPLQAKHKSCNFVANSKSVNSYKSKHKHNCSKSSQIRPRKPRSEWCWQSNDGSWVVYEFLLADQIEKLNVGERYKFVTLDDKQYVITRTSMYTAKQRNLQDKSIRRVKHIAELSSTQILHRPSKSKPKRRNSKYKQRHRKLRSKHHSKHSLRNINVKVKAKQKRKQSGRKLFAIDSSGSGTDDTDSTNGSNESDSTDYKQDCIEHSNSKDRHNHHQNIEQLFFASISARRYNITLISKIKRDAFFYVYASVLQVVTTHASGKRKRKGGVERWLWYGCSDNNAVKKIMCCGFDHSHMRCDNYGCGIYFSTQAKYSKRIANPNDRGSTYLLLCRVIVGNNFCRGSKSITTAPTMKNGKEYDCMVDRLYDPQLFVIWKDYHAVPEYLIKYKRKK